MTQARRILLVESDLPALTMAAAIERLSASSGIRDVALPARKQEAQEAPQAPAPPTPVVAETRQQRRLAERRASKRNATTEKEASQRT